MSYRPVDVATYYAALFPARGDVYSAWTDAGWRPVREPLTPEIVLAGLTGSGPSISGYMIAPGSVTHAFAIDFDTDDGFQTAMKMAALMDQPAYVETSRRGAHLWCVMDRTVPAVAIRRAMRGLLQSIGADGDPKVELRPGSDRVSDDGLGHALRLPLMPHPKTGKTGRMFDAHGESIGRTVSEVLLNIEYAHADGLLAWAERWSPPPITHIPAEHRNPRDYPEDMSTVSEILASLWGVHNARAGRSVRCPAHDDKIASLNIFPDDRRVMCMAGACVLNNDGHGRGTYELRKLAPGHANG